MGPARTDAVAVGVALSPVPIIAALLMLVMPRARADGPAFVLGRLTASRGSSSSLVPAGLATSRTRAPLTRLAA